jgi:hypothetical protein
MTAKSAKNKPSHKVLRTMKHGEVFTREKEITEMLNQVDAEVSRLDSRFLESACGDGNFLEAIVRARFHQILKTSSSSDIRMERDLFSSIASIYGIEILADNVESCRNRIYKITDEFLSQNYRGQNAIKIRKTIRYLISLNIVHGDALNLRQVSDHSKPIVFCEWSFVDERLVKRRDFVFRDLVEYELIASEGLFSDLGEQVFIPTPIKEYPLMDFLELSYE